MDKPLSEADVILGRANVALARSQRLIQSWLPPRQPQDASLPAEEGEEENFAGMSELGGIGSKRASEDDGLPDGSWKRTKLASNDRLLEQLLGPKVARAKKRASENHRAAAAGNHSASKPLPGGLPASERKAGESDDDDEGRTAAFESRKSKRKREKAPSAPVTNDEEDDSQRAGEGLVKNGTRSDVLEDAEAPKQAHRKPGSYLDEVLSRKAKKKRRPV